MENENIDKGDSFWSSIVSIGGAFFFLIAGKIKLLPIDEFVAFIIFVILIIVGCCFGYSYFKKSPEEENQQS
jgi:hypothetical protein